MGVVGRIVDSSSFSFALTQPQPRSKPRPQPRVRSLILDPRSPTRPRSPFPDLDQEPRMQQKALSSVPKLAAATSASASAITERQPLPDKVSSEVLGGGTQVSYNEPYQPAPSKGLVDNGRDGQEARRNVRRMWDQTGRLHTCSSLSTPPMHSLHMSLPSHVTPFTCHSLHMSLHMSLTSHVCIRLVVSLTA